MRKRVKILPVPTTGSKSPTAIATENLTAPSIYGTAPFSPHSEIDDYNDDHQRDANPPPSSADEDLIDFESKLVLNYPDPPMTPPADTSVLTEKGLVDNEAPSIDDELLNFDTCLTLGKSSRSPSNSKKPFLIRSRSKSSTAKRLTSTIIPLFKPLSSHRTEQRVPPAPKCCGSKALPTELWILSMSRIMRVCTFLSQLAFDQVYWKTACISAGVDISFVVQQARTHEIVLDAFSLSGTGPETNVAAENVVDNLLIDTLEINDSTTEYDSTSAQTGSKRRLNELLPKSTALSNHANTMVETYLLLSFPTYIPTRVIISPHLFSWFHTYKSQHSTRKTYLQSPYTFRRQSASHSHGVTCLETTSTGEVITGSWDGTLKVWKLVESAPLSASAKEVQDCVRWDEIVQGRWGRRVTQSRPRPAQVSEGLTVGGEEIEDSVWLNGIENDGLGIGELVDQAEESGRSSTVDASYDTLVNNEPGKTWVGNGRYELELLKSIDTPYPIECMSLHGTHLKQLLQLWDLQTGTLLAAIAKKHDANTSCVKLVQDGAKPGHWFVIEACAKGSVAVWRFVHSTCVKGRVAKPIPDPLRNALDEELVFDLTTYGSVSFVGAFETTGGINSAQIRETGVDCEWNMLCGFKDGNVRGWKVCLKENADETVDDGYERNKIEITATGSLCSLGDWITMLTEDPVADIVIAGAWDGRIRVWDKRKKALRRSLVSDTRSAVLCLKTIGDVLIAGSYNGSIVVYDFSTSK
ncbi:WD40 repeat-like protein [Rhizoclosmatium globosum]|uniref:WD40 repeat-like protein n=1 Tax=Rhizoclosmatium globosum TaxID=329046 RepID=A0A1Y2CF24_9FUNG|nr:WD40 repeat-like protein [Rhizoclosmatium globosum]|eukprot:ORY45663.1 WD40 repeat-like protein [Rhizoclosmatium globosum]